MPQIHFTQIAVYCPLNHMSHSWAHPQDEQAQGLLSTRYWKELAGTLERGCFDGIFFADALAVPDETEEGALALLRHGDGLPRQDPLSLIPVMADTTEHLGFAATLSIISMPPFVAARTVGTLDNMTGGRFAWNVVMGHSVADFRALGMDMIAHDVRYDSGDDYIEICYRLWDGFPRDALVVDKERRIFVDTTKVKRVDYDGTYYQCHAYPVVPCSPQGRPLIFQAGQSGRGMRYGVTHADAHYSIQPRVETMLSHMEAIRATAAECGRSSDPRVFYGLQPFFGSTEEEAWQSYEEARQNVPLDLSVDRLSALIGHDLGQYDPDTPLDRFSTEGGQGLLMTLTRVVEGRPATIREAALQYGMSCGIIQFVGTPEQAADWIEQLWRQVGCYGFGISSPINPLTMEVFADHVIPILQQRGLVRREYAGTTFRENLLQNDG
jgi:FMN-dependent oxidoreductase (nitrilotriacetate monooxygenase family)